MNPAVVFLLCWAACCAGIVGVIAACMNHDRLAVLFLTLINAPVYEEARRIAFLLMAHPEQWTATTYRLSHPRVGEISGSSVNTVSVTGKDYGEWNPTAIERRIIWNAVAWYRRVYIRSLLMRTMTAGSTP